MVKCELCGLVKKYKSKNKEPCPYRKTHKWRMINMKPTRKMYARTR